MGYRERYRHRRKMGYSPEKARRMAKSGCYVATCIYGSYDCPEVWTLRRYRDQKLAKSFLGRIFIRSYYAISPSIIKLFGDMKWFKNFFRGYLDKIVAGLNDNGYDNTPYEDKK